MKLLKDVLCDGPLKEAGAQVERQVSVQVYWQVHWQINWHVKWQGFWQGFRQVSDSVDREML